MSNESDVRIGVIEEIIPRQTQWGTFYDLIVSGQRVGAGKVVPAFSKGDCVKFRVIRNGQYLNVAAGSMERHDGDVPTASTAVVAAVENAKPAPAPSSYATSEQNRQHSILFQSARKDAIEVTKLLVQSDVIGFKSGAKWGDKHDIVMAKINDLTRRFYHDAVGYSEFVGKPLPAVAKEVTGDGD